MARTACDWMSWYSVMLQEGTTLTSCISKSCDGDTKNKKETFPQTLYRLDTLHHCARLRFHFHRATAHPVNPGSQQSW